MRLNDFEPQIKHWPRTYFINCEELQTNGGQSAQNAFILHARVLLTEAGHHAVWKQQEFPLTQGTLVIWS